MTDTVRETILKALEAHMGTMQADLPVDDPYTVQWSIITRENIGQLAKTKRYALGLYDTEETKNPRTYPVTDCILRVAIEFHAFLQQNSAGEKGSETLNRMLGEIERKIREDRTLSGTCIETEFRGNEFTIDGPFDNQVSGVTYLNVLYRHHTDDPRRRV